MNENEFELPFNSDCWKFETRCLASTMLVERESFTIWKKSQVIYSEYPELCEEPNQKSIEN